MRFLFFLFLSSFGLVQGQTSTSSPAMGYVKLAVQPRTDNLLSVPLLQEAVAIGNVLAVTPTTVTLDNSGWTIGQYVPNATPNTTYYAEISTGQLKGLTYRVLSNTADTLTLDLGTDNLTNHRLGAIALGDTVRLRPYWTVGTVFGTTDTTVGLTPFDTLPTPGQADAGDSLLFFDLTAIGLQKVPAQRLVYVKATGWRTLADGTTDQAGFLLPPLAPILVRSHQPAEQAIILLGDAFTAPAVVTLPGGNGTLANDAFVTLAQSEPVSLDHTGLAHLDPTQSIMKGSLSATSREDVLLVFDPTRKGFERPAEHFYYYLSGQGWREMGSSSTTVGQDVLLDPTRGYVLRKRSSSTSVDWRQNP